MQSHYRWLITCLSFSYCFAQWTFGQEKPGEWPIVRLQSEVPAFRFIDNTSPIHSLVYEGETIAERETEVFAFYASPLTLGREIPPPYPAVVLIHGGGGTAFCDWVNLWAERGYAAIAMDLSGHQPPSPMYDEQGKLVSSHGHDRKLRTRLPKGGLDQGHAEKFDSIGGRIDDDWPYHAVANVMRAHTLIRSFQEVDADRTAVTGISWGGYTTCLVASLDNRFKAAVPVYGCGFLFEGESVQKPAIDALGDRRQNWITAYDPSSHLHKCTVPTLWVNGTRDVHYVLDSYAKSYQLVQAPKTIRIEPHMRHSHPHGWAPLEIGLYIDSKLKDGIPLATVGDPEVSPDGTVSVSVDSAMPIQKAELHYTADTGLRSARTWHTLPATVQEHTVVATELPKEANTWLITLTDSRGAMVSTQVQFHDASE